MPAWRIMKRVSGGWKYGPEIMAQNASEACTHLAEKVKEYGLSLGNYRVVWSGSEWDVEYFDKDKKKWLYYTTLTAPNEKLADSELLKIVVDIKYKYALRLVDRILQ